MFSSTLIPGFHSYLWRKIGPLVPSNVGIFMKILLPLLFSLIASPSFAQSKSVRSKNEKTIKLLYNALPEKDFKWRYIVIHHTASEWSSLKRIDRYHRKKFNDPDGIEYHFLIGNGKKSGRGEIEIARWKLQKGAIHLFKPEGAPNAIAISLIGNLHKRNIYKGQYEALLNLVETLMRREKIPIEKVTSHTRVDGNLTVCPGKKFPFKRFIGDLKKRFESPPK